jgi:hypothetical protein
MYVLPHGPSSWGLIRVLRNVKVVKSFYRELYAAREREKADKERALAERIAGGPPDPCITAANWDRFCRYGYFLCPADDRYTCQEAICELGVRCEDMATIGLMGSGKIVPKHQRAKCEARTRQGTPCNMVIVPGKVRCRLHGGLSTGPKTTEGKARTAEAQRKRWHKPNPSPPAADVELPVSRVWRRRKRVSGMAV